MPDRFVWAIGSLCQINRIPFDASLLRNSFPPPHCVRQVLEALQSLNFKAAQGRLNALAYPCIAFLKSEDGAKPANLVRSDGDRVLYFEAGSQEARTAPAGKLDEMFFPEVILARHEEAERLGDGAEPAGRFGFRWF